MPITSELLLNGLFSNSPHIYAIFLPVLVVIFFIIFFRLSLFLYRNHRISKSGMFEIDKMTGSEFEQRLAILFENLGYTVEKTGGIGDFGVDLVIEKEGVRTAVQAKCYNTKRVHPDSVQQVYTGMNSYHCQRAMVVTNSNFTREAWQLAKSVNVKLWSRNYLAKVLLTEQKIKDKKNI